MTHKGDRLCGRIAMDELSRQDRATVKKIMGFRRRHVAAREMTREMG